MKRIYVILFALFAGLMSFTSCNDDFLDRTPIVSISDGAVWKTPDHLKLYVNNFYNQAGLLPQYAGYEDFVYQQDAKSGADTHLWYTKEPNTRMNGATTLPTTDGGWAASDWLLLRNINYFFAHYTNATGDETTINRYVGEALFFRTIFYFEKVKRFGDVPWYDNLLTMTDEDLLVKARDPRNEVVQHLMDDLDKAIGYLPSRTEAAWAGRVNKETALLLQARIALYEGTWEKYHAGTPFGAGSDNGAAFITKAKTATDALIAMGTCALDNTSTGAEDGYYNLFNQASYANSKEVLFWRQFLMGTTQNRWSCYTSTGAGMGLTKRMVDYYLKTDGTPVAANYDDATLAKVVAGRDPRLVQTIYVADGKPWHKRDADTDFTNPLFAGEQGANNTTGYQICKGHNPKYYRAVFGDWCDQGVIYFRYAEALLINAEAKAELGDAAGAAAAIKPLRERVGMPGIDVNAIASFPKQFADLSAIINEVRRERAVELVSEGFRVDDIMRWAAADELLIGEKNIPLGAKKAQWNDQTDDTNIGNAVAALGQKDGYINFHSNNSVGTKGYGFRVGQDYLYPLPIQEMVLNPNLKPNNPGWGAGD